MQFISQWQTKGQTKGKRKTLIIRRLQAMPTQMGQTKGQTVGKQKGKVKLKKWANKGQT